VTGIAAGQTVDTVRRMLAREFDASGIESAELDARILVGEALKLDLTGLIIASSRPITATQATQLEAFARRRIAGEPIARILSRKEFWGLPLQLSAATLVPRPDTETVVERALEITRERTSQQGLHILDIGTGSGAILLALLDELPDAFGVGTDISLEALQTARCNAAGLKLASRAAFVACDYAAALSGAFDLIVSNPPYVRSSDIANLATEVRNHDPLQALDGGADGFAAYRALIPQAARLIGPGGTLVVEAGQSQSGHIEALMTASGLIPDHPPKADLAGIARAVSGRKKPR
jgi:release factor glutamine methyltransferase